MYSELIVMIMANKHEISAACEEISRGYGGQLFYSSDMALIHRDMSGRVSFETPELNSASQPKNSGFLARAFSEAIFGSAAQESRQRLVDAGLDWRFLEDVHQMLERGGSACLIYVPEESLVDTRRYLVILGQLDGTLYHTIFRANLEEALLNIDD